MDGVQGFSYTYLTLEVSLGMCMNVFYVILHLSGGLHFEASLGVCSSIKTQEKDTIALAPPMCFFFQFSKYGQPGRLQSAGGMFTRMKNTHTSCMTL